MSNPMLYKLGLESRSYGIKLFFMWVGYALIQAFVIYLTCFICLTNPS